MGPLSNFCRELGTQKVKTQFSPKDEDKDKDEERGNDDTAVSEVVNIVVTLRHADDTVTLQTNLKITSRPNHILTLSEALFTIVRVLFHYILEQIAAMFDNLQLRWSRKSVKKGTSFSNSKTANICHHPHHHHHHHHCLQDLGRVVAPVYRPELEKIKAKAR